MVDPNAAASTMLRAAWAGTHREFADPQATQQAPATISQNVDILITTST
jgi:hypothetical protein